MKYSYIKSKMNILKKIMIISQFVLFFNKSSAVMKTKADLKSGGSAFIETNNGEVCIIPPIENTFIVTNYKKKDKEKINQLCDIDFSEKELCPKLNSTNPGILVLEQEKENVDCSKKNFSVDAKYKQSITCSYSGSALAAFHLSRILDLDLNTPVSVVKTMDTNRHLDLVNKALGILNGRQSEVIYKTWSQFKSKYPNKSDENLFVDRGNYVYGALSENIKKEYIYTEVSGIGPYDTRYERFKTQTPYSRVSNNENLNVMFPQEFNSPEKLAPKIKQMEDVTNMVILDTLLSQDDRIGNIHFYISWGQINNGELKLKKLNKDELSSLEKLYIKNRKKDIRPSRWTEKDFEQLSDQFDSTSNLQSNGGSINDSKKFLVREMVLKDNDCGVDVDKRSNKMRQIDAIEGIRHISIKSYQNLLKFYSYAKSNLQTVKNFFLNSLLYREKDFIAPSNKSSKDFMSNLEKVVKTLKENCKSGKLKRDLNYNFDQNNQWLNQDPGPSVCEI